nr:helix-turn-helix domain-containing protein [Streptomyces sp. NBC_00899]
MPAQGQAVRDITSLLHVSEDYVRDVNHAFNERGFDALDPKWSGGRPSQRVLRELVEQCWQERPIARCEADSLAVQLPLQDRDLMAKGQDLRVLVPLVHRQQAQGREHVRHAQVGEFMQHE